MASINIIPQYAESVKNGVRLHCINKDRVDVGELIHFYKEINGERYKLTMGICTEIHDLLIDNGGLIPAMELNGEKLRTGKKQHSEHKRLHDDDFAEAQGFKDFNHMWDYYKKHYGLPFKGFVVLWDLQTTKISPE